MFWKHDAVLTIAFNSNPIHSTLSWTFSNYHWVQASEGGGAAGTTNANKIATYKQNGK